MKVKDTTPPNSFYCNGFGGSGGLVHSFYTSLQNLGAENTFQQVYACKHCERSNIMNQYVKSDLFRYYGKCDYTTFVKAILRNRTFRFQYAFRMVQSSGISKYWGYFLWILNRSRKSIQLPRTTKVGYGLYIGHNGPIVVNPSTVIGNNVNLSQFTTIGSNRGKAAKIGDNVYIGPNVCIVEDVIIGDNVTIGAGSVVTKNIPDNATAVGNYAKVINYNDPGRYVTRRWINS